MKKLYIIMAFALMSYGAFAQTETMFADAETATPTFTTWNQAHTVTIVDNPLSDAVNSTAKVYYFNGGAWGGMANWNNAGTTIKPEYTTLEFDVYVAEGGLAAGPKAYFKTQCDNSISAAAILDKGKDITEAGKWVKVSIDITTRAASDYKQFAIQSEVGQYYIDNIKFISPTQTAIEGVKTASQIIAGKGSITVKGAEGKAIDVLSVTGAVAAKKNTSTSSETIHVKPGIYMVIVDGKATKVFVK
jgi:hypothetical protein